MRMNKVRKRFVIYAMVAIFVLLTALLLVINGVNFTMVAEDADRITEMIANDKGRFGEEQKRMPDQNAPKGFGRMDSMGPGSPERAVSFRYFTYRFDKDKEGEEVVFNISAFTKEEAKELAEKLLQEKTGWINTNYRYRVYKSGDYTYVTVVDLGRELLPSYRILIISLIGEVIVLAMSFGFLLVISKKLFRPLEETDRKQQKFLAQARNEFQIPLTVINANAELLEKENGSNEYTQSIHRQVKKLTELTRQLDTYLVLEEGEERRATCDLSMIVLAATDGAMSKYQKAGIRITREIETGVPAMGEEEALHRIVAELVENSLKFSKSYVNFSLKKEEGHVQLETSNDCNLAQQNMEQIFDRFTKLENANEDVGNGLGLSYVKDIVKANNGRVSAWLEKGEFHLRITL